MDEVVRCAFENVRSVYKDAEWSTMNPSQQATLIYGEIRRLDLERVKWRQQNIPPDGDTAGQDQPGPARPA